jgi:hypothetical protein
LGHEENDMMRALVIVEPPMDPSGLTAVASGSDAVLNWVDNSVNETSFTLQKSVDPTFPATTTTSFAFGPDVTTYTDVGAAAGAFYYRVMASNTVGADPISAPGYAQMTADSGWSNTAQIAQVPVATVTPLSLTFGDQIIGTTSAPQTVTLTNSGVVPLTFTTTVTGDFAQTNSCGGTVAVGGNCAIDVTFTPTVEGVQTGSLIIDTNDPANPSFTVTLSGTGLSVLTVPATPTNLTGVAVPLPVGTYGYLSNDQVTLNWTDNATNEAGFTIQRVGVLNNPNACVNNTNLVYQTVGTVGVDVTTYSEVATRIGNLCYRVQAFNAAGVSAWAYVFVTTP